MRSTPYDQMEELADFQDDEMVVYCWTGRRSGITLEVLHEHGFVTAVNGGGLDDLVAQGVPATN